MFVCVCVCNDDACFYVLELSRYNRSWNLYDTLGLTHSRFSITSENITLTYIHFQETYPNHKHSLPNPNLNLNLTLTLKVFTLKFYGS